MTEFCGPCWNALDTMILWLIDGDWTEKRITPHYGGSNIERDLTLLKRFVKKESLSEDDYAFLCRKHYIKKSDRNFILNLVSLKQGAVKEQLLALAKNKKRSTAYDRKRTQ